MYRDAIEKIENQSNEMIAIEYDAPKNKDHIILTQMNKSNLKIGKRVSMDGKFVCMMMFDKMSCSRNATWNHDFGFNLNVN